MNDLTQVMERYKPWLLSLPGCTGVGLGFKEIGEKIIDQLAIVIFVKKKRKDIGSDFLIPKMLEEVPTDVVEQNLGLELTATDPFDRFDKLFSGISITPRDAPPIWGTLGCIVRTSGNANVNVPPGVYLLTN
jgi:hypothetical protein